MKHINKSVLLYVIFSTTVSAQVHHYSVATGSISSVTVPTLNVATGSAHETVHGPPPVRYHSKSKRKSKGKQGGAAAPATENCPAVAPTSGESEQALIDIAGKPEFADCFKDREVYNETTKPKYDVAEDFIDSDKESCECFEKSVGGQSVKDGQGKELEEQEEDLKSDILVSNIKTKNKHLQTMTDGLRVQALFLSGLIPEESKRLEFMGLYNEKVDQDTESTVAEYKKSLLQAGSMKYTRNQVAFQETVKSIQPPKELSVSSMPSDEIPKEPKGACFSMRTFISWEQQPKGDEFLSALGKEQFKPENWDIESLKDQYDRAYRDFDSERGDQNKRSQLKKPVDAIKARILYLKNNPLYATLFTAKGSGLTPNQKVALGQRKEELFKNLQKKYAGRPSCKIIDSACLEQRKADDVNIDNAIRGVFEDASVWKATREQFNDTITDEYQDIEGVMDQKLPGTQFGLQRKYRDMTGKSVLHCSQWLDKLPTPEAKARQKDVCHQNFPLYCKMVDKVHERIGDAEMFTKPSDDLDAEKTIDFNPDPATHEDFTRLTKMFCNTKRVSRKNPGESATFEQFKEKYCAKGFWGKVTFGVFSSSDCDNPKFLLSLYLESYEIPKGEYRPAGWDSYEKSFIAHASTNRVFKDLTTEQVNQVNDKSVPTSSIRKYGAREGLARSFPSFGAAPAEGIVAPIAPTKALYAPGDAGPLKPEEFVASAGAVAPKKPAEVGPQEEGKAEKTPEDVLKEKKKLKDEFDEKTRQLSDIKDKKAYEDMEKRLAALQRQLDDKDDEYRRLVEAAAKKDKEVATKKKAKGTPTPVDEDDSEEGGPKGHTAFAGAKGNFAEGAGRGPASVPDQGGFGAGSVGGGSGLAAGAAGKGGKLNKALLEKYGITVADVPGNSILLADVKDEGALKLVTDAHQGLHVPVVVSASQYEKFKLNDLESLKDLYDKKLKSLSGDIMKISISTKGGEKPLEFYAIREGDKVIFQPVRKHKLKNMKDALGTI